MMRCTQTLILILALLLTNCMATPTSQERTSETLATVTLAVTATPRPAPIATVTMTVPAAVTVSATVTATTGPTLTPSATATRPLTRQPSPAPPTATATATAAPEAPMVVLTANANLRAGPDTAYPVIGGGKVGQTLIVTGRANGSAGGLPVTWWRTARGWVAGSLVTANAAAQTVPLVMEVPPPPAPTVVPAPTVTPSPQVAPPDLVVLGPETQYPVRARVIRGWDYEFVDLSTQYDIMVYRDVFGMLAHQIDDDNVPRYKRSSRFAEYGPIRITLIDAQPHPDPNCPGWGWAPDRDTFVDPYGMTQNSCRAEHSLFPQGDGAGTTLLLGWGYHAGTTVAVGAAGPFLANFGVTLLAEQLPRPAAIGPADRPDYAQSRYQPLGQARREHNRWVWNDPFAQLVPSAR